LPVLLRLLRVMMPVLRGGHVGLGAEDTGH
jgi:hypothetical protein